MMRRKTNKLMNDLIQEIVTIAQISYYTRVSSEYYLTHYNVTKHETDKYLAKECLLRLLGIYDPSVHPVTAFSKLVESEQYKRKDIIERMKDYIAKIRKV